MSTKRGREEPKTEPEELDEVDLDDELDEDELEADLEDEVLDDEELDLVDDEEEDVAIDADAVTDADEDDDEEEEEEDDDEVESALDDILRERFVVSDLDDEPSESEGEGDTLTRVRPRQPDEFVCQSCFLVKSMTQLADVEKMFCRDCV